MNIYLEMKFLDHIVVSFLFFWGIYILFSSVAAPISFSPTVQEGSLSPIPSPAPVICRLSDTIYSDECEMIFHCGFDFHIPGDQLCWAFFHMPVVCLSSLEKCLLSSCLFFFNWVVYILILSYVSFYYIYIHRIVTTYQIYHLQAYSLIQ